MQSLEWTFTNKSEWPAGPWHNEFDKRQWMDVETGLPCLIVRGPVGALCGYVGVPKGHPWYKAHYDSCDVEVHGGLTFAGLCQERDPEHGICHIGDDGEDDHPWWLGFDCAHCDDLAPSYVRHYGNPGSYRDARYVAAEVEKLARQIKAAS